MCIYILCDRSSKMMSLKNFYESSKIICNCYLFSLKIISGFFKYNFLTNILETAIVQTSPPLYLSVSL